MGDHDLLFKRAFSVPEHAAGEIRSVLPAGVTARMELEGMCLLPGFFVDYVYFLFEHQSEPDRLMTYRVITYVVRIWDRVLRDEPDRRTLPIVVPVIIRHGRAGWVASDRDPADIPAIEASMASPAEQLIQRGMERGLKEGRHEANRTTLARLLQLRFGGLAPVVEARIAEGSPEQLEAWLERFATADTLDAIFAD